MCTSQSAQEVPLPQCLGGVREEEKEVAEKEGLQWRAKAQYPGPQPHEGTWGHNRYQQLPMPTHVVS